MNICILTSRAGFEAFLVAFSCSVVASWYGLPSPTGLSPSVSLCSAGGDYRVVDVFKSLDEGSRRVPL